MRAARAKLFCSLNLLLFDVLADVVLADLKVSKNLFFFAFRPFSMMLVEMTVFKIPARMTEARLH